MVDRINMRTNEGLNFGNPVLRQFSGRIVRSLSDKLGRNLFSNSNNSGSNLEMVAAADGKHELNNSRKVADSPRESNRSNKVVANMVVHQQLHNRRAVVVEKEKVRANRK